MLGADYKDKDFKSISTQAMYFIRSFRNAVGDIDAPGVAFWAAAHKSGNIMAQIMIWLIWLCWFMHEFLCLIVLLNFLIAVIS